mmetsp:Transcript_22741/g.52406  ORF Transcript_22741/g.52406 Transcript_22741/m.52406 type:complete len:207 (+) Transcript_22741:241-861(+)
MVHRIGEDGRPLADVLVEPLSIDRGVDVGASRRCGATFAAAVGQVDGQRADLVAARELLLEHALLEAREHLARSEEEEAPAAHLVVLLLCHVVLVRHVVAVDAARFGDALELLRRVQAHHEQLEVGVPPRLVVALPRGAQLRREGLQLDAPRRVVGRARRIERPALQRGSSWILLDSSHWEEGETRDAFRQDRLKNMVSLKARIFG